MNVLDYEIITKKLYPSIGNYNFYSEIQFLYIVTDKGSKNVDPKLGETYGETENVSRSKMRLKLEKWIADQKM